MKFKKFVLVLSAAAMMGSLYTAVPAMAETTNVTTEPINVTLAGKARNTAADFSGDINTGATVSVDADTNIKLEYNSSSNVYVGAYYYFDTTDISIPEGATDVKATLKVKQGTNFSNINLNVWALDTTDLSDTFNATDVTAAVNKAITADSDGDIQSKAIDTSDPNARYSVFEGLPFNATDGKNAYFIFSDACNNRYLTSSATLTVSYTYEAPVAPIVQNAVKAEDFDASDAAVNADAQVWTANVTGAENITYTSAEWTITVAEKGSATSEATLPTLTGGDYLFGVVLSNVGENVVTNVTITVE